MMVIAGTRGPSGHFGTGIYATGKEPQSFPSKEAVLFNNHWPTIGDCETSAQRQAPQLLATGDMDAGPQDPRNHPVCDWILADESRSQLADYCVPLIVPELIAYNIWERLPPDLAGWCPGCNRWGEKQWPEREQLGPTHPDTLTSVDNLAGLLKAMGVFDEAETLYRRALEGSKRKLGSTHPDTLTSLNNLAGLLQAVGKLDEAESLYRRALKGSKETLGPAHLDTLTSMNNLAGLLQARGLFSEAEELYRVVLHAREEALGPTDPRTLRSVCSLAALVERMGGEFEAERLFRRACTASSDVLGPAHPETSLYSSELADFLGRIGKLEEASAALGRLGKA
mmetsp:Transcript_9599/g.26759  ORF Transcript_9599/g.26759 Transcript_9599/m.26759 type:complete len:340 (+) Transcript_9599:1-1020(+)